MLIEARWLWDGDVLRVAHVRARGIVRGTDFGFAGVEGERIIFESGALRCAAIEHATFRLVEDAAALPWGPLGEFRTTKGVALAAALHATLLAMAFIGRAAPHEDEAAQLEVMKELSAALDAREVSEAPPVLPRDEPMPSRPAEPGRAGTTAAPKPVGRAENRGTSRATELRAAREFGMIALLSSATDERNRGDDPFTAYEGPSAIGSIFGTTIEDAYGSGGAHLSGTGLGGGGRGEGVGLMGLGQGFGACGCGAGMGNGGVFAHGGRLGATHQVRSPSLRCGIEETTGKETCATQVKGRLPPEIVQRVVRQNFGRMRICYEAGLGRNPSLEGRISVKFVIDRSGAVAMASAAERSLNDSAVATCVENAFKAMSFPEPEGGIVTVVYPLVLST